MHLICTSHCQMLYFAKKKWGNWNFPVLPSEYIRLKSISNNDELKKVYVVLFKNNFYFVPFINITGILLLGIFSYKERITSINYENVAAVLLLAQQKKRNYEYKYKVYIIYLNRSHKSSVSWSFVHLGLVFTTVHKNSSTWLHDLHLLFNSYN